MISICISTFPVILAAIYNALMSASMNEQAFYTDVEVVIISTYSLILMIIEVIKINKYKKPAKEKPKKEDSVNSSLHGLMSSSSKQSGKHSKMLGKDRFNKLKDDLEDNLEDDLTDRQKLNDPHDARIRYSIQDPHIPMFTETNQSALEEKRLSSMPNMKLKEYKDLKRKKAFNDFLESLHRKDRKFDQTDEDISNPKSVKSPSQKFDKQNNAIEAARTDDLENTKEEIDLEKSKDNDETQDELQNDKSQLELQSPSENDLNRNNKLGIDPDDDDELVSQAKIDRFGEEEKQLSFSHDDDDHPSRLHEIPGDAEDADDGDELARVNKVGIDPDQEVDEEGEGDIQLDHGLKRSLTQEQEKPLDGQIQNEAESGLGAKSVEGGIIGVDKNDGDKNGDQTKAEKRKEEKKNSKKKGDKRDDGNKSECRETSNGVLDTPPSEPDDDDDLDIEVIDSGKPKAKQMPNSFRSNKSESSVESMMEDTPSNYNIPNGRYDERSKAQKLRKMNYNSNLEIITEIERPSAPSHLASIKHIKTTKNERQFIDSMLGSDRSSNIGGVGGSALVLGNGSDKGPATDVGYLRINPYEIRRYSKSNVRNGNPSRSLEQSNQFYQKPKFNKYMISNQGSEDNSIIDGILDHRRPNLKAPTENSPSEAPAQKSGLPPINYPKLKKRKKVKKKKLKIIEDKNLSLTNVNDLESAYLSKPHLKDPLNATQTSYYPK